MRVMRSNLDGLHIETLVEAGRGAPSYWCVGFTIGADRGHTYWTHRGPDNGECVRIFRANLEVPSGQNAANRRELPSSSTDCRSRFI
jgi:hypothetical protein